MKSFLISDNKDTLVGLRLSGIDGVLTTSKKEINENFKRTLEDKDIGIIILTENVFNEIKEEVLEVKINENTPLIVTIPDRTGLKDKNFIMRYVKESIGIKI
ncbi:V-type ATP synthase subunit F [Tissierella sp. MSJ-40]|uniref:V-type ATP synthase subunit F n=1 Tax=Tissierella simiarum TaxID=2841534 RepID=A0ABS6E9G1_9FIRM|nr:V-type ATP synthase subunit F [Tissierella simiarum]MBU5439399.1 V-type ATP synthase subunit F [Tissierella simiarum]